MESIWKKFIPCDCQCEGIMISYEQQDREDSLPYIDLAFFRHGFDANYPLTLRERIRWCWHIFIKGEIWNDMVMLNPKNAKVLADELLKFANKKEKIQ